jgi:hypothetical protein
MPRGGGVADHPQKDKPTGEWIEALAENDAIHRTNISDNVARRPYNHHGSNADLFLRVRGPLRAKISAATRLASRLLLGT